MHNGLSMEGLFVEITTRDGEMSSVSIKISTYFIPVNNSEVNGCVLRQGGESSLKTSSYHQSNTTVYFQKMLCVWD